MNGRSLKRAGTPASRGGAPRRASARRRAEGVGAFLKSGKLTFWLTALLLGAALLLGGASRENAIQLALLELLSLPLIPLALWRLHRQGALAELRVPLVLLAAILILPLAQLVPLPITFWESLPGRGEIAEAMRLAGAQPAFLPFSVTPEATWGVFLTLLVPAAIFLGAGACSTDQWRRLSGLVVLAVGLSVVLGLAQVAGGPQSPLRLYPTTNPESAVGLFANRNHQAIFLLIALPLLAHWIGLLARDGRERLLLLGVVCLALLGITLVGVAITQSRTGLVLTAPALVGVFVLLWRQRAGGARGLSVPIAGAVLVAAAALASIGLFALDAILGRFSPTFGDDYRIEIWPYVANAAGAFSPAGTGLGSFEAIYRAFEPVELMSPSFVNHAHNEYLQLWLEGGWAGLALLALVGLWVARRSAWAWFGAGERARQAQAASIVIGVLALHSVVDYPARTPTIMAVLALMVAALAAVRPPQSASSSSRRDS